MIATYTTGCNQAHKFIDDYRKWFVCPMFATFNMRVRGIGKKGLFGFEPSKTFIEGGKHHTFWLVRLNESYYAWAFRWGGSAMPHDILELVSKRLLPEHLKTGAVDLEILEPWSQETIGEFARRHWRNQWHQTFSWSPPRCDSALLWEAMLHVGWAESTVLDIGCNYGYHSFRASQAGAHVVGFDKDPGAVAIAENINDHIEMQDVRFVDADPGGAFDHILYLSVHHQWDPGYDRLAGYLDTLRSRAKRSVFVELILPPMFGGKRSEQTVDAIVGGTPLLRYQHRVRGVRKLYEVSPRTPTTPQKAAP